MTKLKFIIERLNDASKKAEDMAYWISARYEFNLGSVMTLGGGDLEQNKKDHAKYIGLKETLHKLLVDEINNLVITIDNYYLHLTEKMERNGYIVNEDNGNYKFDNDADIKPNEQLENRYKALLVMQEIAIQLDPNQKDQLPDQLNMLEEQLTECINNKPSWSERPFLQKLADVLSLGIAIGYRHFFSKENDLQNRLNDRLTVTPGF